MYVSYLSNEYEAGIREYVSYAVKNADDFYRIIFFCLRCCYLRNKYKLI